jgi:hypothetical protein
MRHVHVLSDGHTACDVRRLEEPRHVHHHFCVYRVCLEHEHERPLDIARVILDIARVILDIARVILDITRVILERDPRKLPRTEGLAKLREPKVWPTTSVPAPKTWGSG